MAEKEHWWREESITAYPKEEDPISENSKKTLPLSTLKRILSMRNLKGTLITVKLKDNTIIGDPEKLQDPQWLLRCKLTFFGFLVMVYDRVDDGDKFSKKNFGLGKLRFHATSQLKVSPVLTPESEIVSVYMVYLQRMSHQFQIDVISAFYSKFWNQFSKLFFLVFSFWHLKKTDAIRLQFAIFLVINIYCFFDDHDTWLLLLEYFLWFVQVSALFERLFKCYFAVPISLTRTFRKKAHTHNRRFSFEKSWAKFFLKLFVFAIQF